MIDLGADVREVAVIGSAHEGLIAKALALDPANGEAYAVRAYLTAFGDLQGAERDYRRSIELSPNNAAAFAGLAAVLYETVDKRDEALAMLERARQLDPLEPRYAVTKAVFLMFWRGQVSPALAELRGVVERDPLYQPALARYGEALGCLDGQQAEGIKYLEQAIDLDPDAASTVSLLIQGYINLREVAAAEEVVEDIGHGMPSRRLYLQLYRRQWRAAGESAYAAFADGTMIPYDGRLGSIAVRMHARETKSFAPAIALLEEQAGVTWDASGQPRFPMQTGVAVATVALGDMLIADGQLERGRRLLRASLADMDRVMRDYGRTDLWYGPDRAIALALLGEDAAALAEIRRASAAYGGCSWWAFLNTEPAFEKVRNDPEFKSVLAKVLERTAKESASLARMREAGLVPKRPGATSGG